MTVTLQYGNEVIALPGAAAQVMKNASAEDLRCLLLLCAEPALREDPTRLCDRLGCTEEQMRLSLAFWRGAGVLTIGEDTGSVAASVSAQTDTPTVVVASTPTASPFTAVARVFTLLTASSLNFSAYSFLIRLF